jgi:hypothetical protein
MTTLNQVHAALADAVRATGWSVRSDPSDNITEPVIHVDSLEFDPRMVLSEQTSTYPFLARAFVGRTAERASLLKLNNLRDVAGAGSLVAAVQDEDNWPDGLVHYASVTLVGRREIFTVADAEYFGCDFDIEVVF